MCGIWSYIELINNYYTNYFNDYMNIKPRGPDMSSFQIIKNVFIGFHRLAIMNPTFNGNQPFIFEENNKTIVFICNGEIYNFKELIHEHKLDIIHNSDCMTIPKLYLKYDYNTFINLFNNEIKGEFAFLLFEFDKFQRLTNIISGRDQIGIRPLYWNRDLSKGILFSSEIKGMINFNDKVKEFEPGSIVKINIDEFNNITQDVFNFRNVYNVSSVNLTEEQLLLYIRNAVINSVKRRLESDKPIAFLLSGGVDSSLVAAISAKLLGTPIKTYCCGMEEGTDLLYARMVSDHIKSNHTQVFFTPQEGVEAIDDVVSTIESWDTTSIRASVGQYLVCKHIGTKTDARVVFVGEGPDEVCSSYLFNYNAPNGEELHNTAIEYVKNIHMYDGRRADRCISRWGLEGRIALLDPEFIEAYWMIPSEWRHPNYKGIEKWWLRKAFEGTDILPDQVLWRKKEAFSDGVSSKKKSWFQIIQEYIQSKMINHIIDPNIIAPTQEAYYFKSLFVDNFGYDRLDIIPNYWQPKWTGTNGYIDPSARVLNVYNE